MFYEIIFILTIKIDHLKSRLLFNIITGLHYAGSEAEWNLMFDKFVQETDSSEKLKLMRGLTGIRESWLLSKLVHFLYKFRNKQYLCNL